MRTAPRVERTSPAADRPGRRARAPALLLLALLAVTGVPAAADEAMSAAAAVVEQKLRLLESYFASPTAQRILDGGDAAAVHALARARGLAVDARDALAGGDAAQASAMVDDALRTFSAASRVAGRAAAPPASGPQRTRYRELRDAIGAFRATLDKARGAGGDPAVDLATLDAESARAEKLAAEGYFDRANALLADVYQSTMQAISSARGSETVVYRLEFETPADELAYERERFRGNELLLGMLEGGGASDSAKRLAARYAEEARARRDAALAMAAAGEVPAAIAAMEEAGALLARALRTLGLSLAQ